LEREKKKEKPFVSGRPAGEQISGANERSAGKWRRAFSRRNQFPEGRVATSCGQVQTA